MMKKDLEMREWKTFSWYSVTTHGLSLDSDLKSGNEMMMMRLTSDDVHDCGTWAWADLGQTRSQTRNRIQSLCQLALGPGSYRAVGAAAAVVGSDDTVEEDYYYCAVVAGTVEVDDDGVAFGSVGSAAQKRGKWRRN